MLSSGFIFLQRDWLSSNSLLVSDENSSFLFDSGYVTHSEQLLQLVRHELGDQPLDVVVNTHLHSDHCGGNALLQSSFPQLKCWIPHSQFDSVLNWDDSSLTFALTGQSCDRFHPTDGLRDSDCINLCGLDWLVFSSPGHDNDSLIYFQPDHKVLISADALWENGFSVVFPEFIGGIGFQNVSVTYDLIDKLNPAIVIPGHGSMFTDVNKALESSRRRLDQFHRNPKLHAAYAAKVMIKFKVMEFRQCNLTSLVNWAFDSKLLFMLHANYFDGPLKSWIESVINELIQRKALSFSNEIIYDCK
jgi:glyoxylase-like metal-dependent hydrolase (beta-lactamase superfamily II)